MTDNHIKENLTPLILALHSSSETFGIGLINGKSSKKNIKCKVFPIGRELSKKVFTCIEEVLALHDLKKLHRIAVATGPGGFTGTRITVAIARTLASQIGCPLDGISSFTLMAARLASNLSPSERDSSFWIIKNLPRRGIIGGKYQLEKSISQREDKTIKIFEVEEPHLLKPEKNVSPYLYADNNIKEDVNELLNICLENHLADKPGKWKDVLPIYPTSPVD
tara:strand:+ start:1472 stop:2137 length:666 start_codon:yes stop_codon:yes gene_type:complete